MCVTSRTHGPLYLLLSESHLKLARWIFVRLPGAGESTSNPSNCTLTAVVLSWGETIDLNTTLASLKTSPGALREGCQSAFDVFSCGQIKRACAPAYCLMPFSSAPVCP